MKLLPLLLLICLDCGAQKINSCTYKNVDTVVTYKNGETITYKKNGKMITDTIYFPLKCNIKIYSANVVIIDDEKTLGRRPKLLPR